MDSLNYAFDRAGGILNRKPKPGNAQKFSGVPFLPEKGDPWPQSVAQNGFFPITSASGYIGIDTTNTVSRTVLNSGNISLVSLDGNTPGFTPIPYYRPNKEVAVNPNPFVDNQPSDVSGSSQFKDTANRQAFIDYGNLSYYKLNDSFSPTESTQGDFHYSNKGIPSDRTILPNPNNPSDSRLYEYTGTPHDNEDPVYFSFEIILNVDNSPLLNGEVERFLNALSYSTGVKVDEFRARDLGHISIINQFKREMKRWFKLNREFTSDEFDTDSHIFHEPIDRRYYLKGVKGLEKLIERNMPGNAASFVDYGKDLITLTFTEDVTLNMGTLAALYKELYWSRLRGKGIVPENLLRFDCRIIVCEMRNFVRVANFLNSGNINAEANTDSNSFANGTEVLKQTEDAKLMMLRDNLTRYVYDLYECQFFFDKMSHPDAIDMSAPVKVDSYDINLSFKYSTMMFERFDHPNTKWKRISNKYGNPLEINSDTFPEAKNAGNRYNYHVKPDSLSWYDNSNRSTTLTQAPTSNGSDSTTNNPDPNSIYQYPSTVNQNTIDNLNNQTKAKTSIYEAATTKLLSGLKTAALNEAQRQLNSKFRLLNQSLDKIRNSFGIGRMKEPVNVYNKPFGQYSTVFFDVKNSLRNFGGDTLGGIVN